MTFEVGFGFGSNVGDKIGNIRRAVSELESSGIVADLQLSSMYRTAPWGYVDQDWFVNACAVGKTRAKPTDLLSLCQAIESRMGRRRVIRWGPRNIDVDILFYEGVRLDLPALRLPHPELLNRAFVLAPLAEIRPDLVIGATRLSEALRKLDTTDVQLLPAV